MKRLAGYIATTILFCSACGGGNAAKTSATTTAAINFQEITIKPEAIENGIADTLKFGEMRSGEIIAKTLRVRNGCNNPIVLLRHTTTCGCIKITYDRKPIAPNSSADICFEFDTRTLHGWQMKLMEFYFAEKGKPLKVYAEAEVE
ncbi:MAG: DUF1573 domain-containing protein [Rikenellaceae bacterium]|nr:DUF1573 domain-containing protein [Rikenellaceae bacterium]